MLSLWDHRVNIKYNIRYRTLSALSASSVVCPLCCLCLPYLLTLSAPLPLSTLSAGSVCHSISVCPLCWPCLPSLLALSTPSAGPICPLCWPCLHPLCWPCLPSLLALSTLSAGPACTLSAGPVCSLFWLCVPLYLCLSSLLALSALFAGPVCPSVSVYQLGECLGSLPSPSGPCWEDLLDIPPLIYRRRKVENWANIVGGGGGDRPARSTDM